jgi:hypothetical protein
MARERQVVFPGARRNYLYEVLRSATVTCNALAMTLATGVLIALQGAVPPVASA